MESQINVSCYFQNKWRDQTEVGVLLLKTQKSLNTKLFL